MGTRTMGARKPVGERPKRLPLIELAQGGFSTPQPSHAGAGGAAS